MSPVATENYLADLVSDLSEAFRILSNEGAKLSSLLARSEALFLSKGTMSYGSSPLPKSRPLRNT
jgi:hypothetical protein